MKKRNPGQFKKGHQGFAYWKGKKRGRTPEAVKGKISASLMGKKKTAIHARKIGLGKVGKKNPRWTGGRFVTPSGHVLIYSPDHPRRNANNRIFEHRVVMEKKLRRILPENEHVHHIDCNPANNEISNLFLTTGKGNAFAHGSLNKLVAGLLADGILKFNKRKGIYERRNPIV